MAEAPRISTNGSGGVPSSKLPNVVRNSWAPELREVAREDFKLSFEEPGPTRGRALVNGFERLIHQLRGLRIGVALGGGAARGMAHLGVLKALEQNGIVVDMISGTSAGAMTGTLIAAGLDADYCTESFVKDLTPSWLFRHLPRGSHWYLLYKYRRGQFDPMLRPYLSDSKLEQLPIPMSAVTVDLVSGEIVVRDTGDAVHNILESINLPVLSVPICREGKVLVDGGLVNNVPADVLVGKGCNFVVAVSVTAKMEQEFGKNALRSSQAESWIEAQRNAVSTCGESPVATAGCLNHSVQGKGQSRSAVSLGTDLKREEESQHQERSPRSYVRVG